MTNNVQQYLLDVLPEEDAQLFDTLMKSDHGGAQAFQHFIYGLANQDYEFNPLSEYRRIDPEIRALIHKLYEYEFLSYTFYKHIGIRHLQAAGYQVDAFFEWLEGEEIKRAKAA